MLAAECLEEFLRRPDPDADPEGARRARVGALIVAEALGTVKALPKLLLAALGGTTDGR